MNRKKITHLTVVPRDYQEEAVDAAFNHWLTSNAPMLLVMATGSGKSIVIALLIQQALAKDSKARVLVLTHVKELVEQDYNEMINLWPDAPAGVNCAGLKKRSTDAQIIFGSIQSVWNHCEEIGQFDYIVVDEAHRIPHKDNGNYRKLITLLSQRKNTLKVIGLTATPFRLDGGWLHIGEERLFEEIIYDYSVDRGITEGWLSPLVSKRTQFQINISGVRKRAGEYRTDDLDRLVNSSENTDTALTEIIEQGANRRSWLIYCVSVAHANSVAEKLRQKGIVAQAITEKTPAKDRDKYIKEFRAGSIKCIVNVSVLTTGFNNPRVDLIAMLRPTLSTALYLQICGRGLRKSEGKENCQILDFVENIRRHGRVDDPEIIIHGAKGADDTQETPQYLAKACPACLHYSPIKALTCSFCDKPFARERKIIHNSHADSIEILGRPRRKFKQQDKFIPVRKVTAQPHIKRGAFKVTSIKIEYHLSTGETVKEFIKADNGAISRMATLWWQAVMGTTPPASIDLFCRELSSAKVHRLQTYINENNFRAVEYLIVTPQNDTRTLMLAKDKKFGGLSLFKVIETPA